jgi:hypothetical protein
MKYLVLIQSNPRGLGVWATLTDRQRTDSGRNRLVLTDEMAEAGVLIAAEGLADPALARRVRVRDGATVVSAGPFADVREHLAGFYLIDCPGWDEAVAWAAKVPGTPHTEVEVRPVLDMSGGEF